MNGSISSPAGLTSPISGSDISDAAIGVAKLANGTDGELITWGTDAAATVVAAGSATEVLTSNGAGTAPTFQAAAGGGQSPYDAVVAASGGDYTTVKDAHDAGMVKILIQGTVTETTNFTMDGDLRLFGKDANTDIWDMDGTEVIFAGSGTDIEVLMQDISLINAGHAEGIKVYNCDKFSMNRVRVSWAGASGTRTALSIGSDLHTQVRGCYIDASNQEKLGEINSSKLCNITDNVFLTENNTTATNSLSLSNSSTATVNYIGNYMLCGRNAISLNGTGPVNIVGNTFRHQSNTTNGVYVYQSASFVTISGNTFDGTDGGASSTGVTLEGFTHATITGNIFEDTNRGVFSNEGSDPAIFTVSGNTFNSQSDHAIILFSPNASVTGNVIVGATNHAISCSAVTDNCVISNNILMNNGDTIQLNAGSIGNTITGNVLIGNTVNLIDNVGVGNNVYGNIGSASVEESRSLTMKNTSGGQIDAGDLVTTKAVAAGNEVTTTANQGDDLVIGMAEETIADNGTGFIKVLGKTTAMKVDGTTDIAIGDFIGTFTSAGIGMKAAAGDMAIAIALEAYTTDDSAGVIDALLITPRKI